jgi:hypothetical protein
MVVAARGIRLPDLKEDVPSGRAHAVEDAAFDANALALRLGRDEHVGEVLLKDVEPDLLRDEADVDIGTAVWDGISFRLGRDGIMAQFPYSLFSNSVERRPRSTMSKR